MKIYVYIYFPESDDELEKLGDDPQKFKEIIKVISVIKNKLREHREYELCYNSENVEEFLSKAEILINEEYLSNCRTQVEILFSRFCKNVNKIYLRKPDYAYLNWNIVDYSVSNVNVVLAEAAASVLSKRNQTAILDLSKSLISLRENLHVIIDAIHDLDLPQLTSIPVLGSDVEFVEWLTSFSDPNFSIRDKTIFYPTQYRWVKQRIYKKISDGCLWYFDYFHESNSSHFEVFDDTGETHLGEASMAGELNKQKADKDKKINHIIH
jgi:hypothetical protein